MRKRQYRLCQTGRTLQIRDSQSALAASIAFDGDDHAVIQAGEQRFSIGRESVLAQTSSSGIYASDDQKLEWKPLSMWHGVYGWTSADGSVAVRFVPLAQEDTREYLITVERPIEDELRVVATGAYLLKMAGTDFVAWSAAAGAVEMRG